MMSPYGGTIYVIVTKAHYNNPFDITINGVIDMPYFIQGRCKVHNFCLNINSDFWYISTNYRRNNK